MWRPYNSCFAFVSHFRIDGAVHYRDEPLERSLSLHIFCCLVFAQPQEPAVPQVRITGPFDILKLSHQHGL